LGSKNRTKLDLKTLGHTEQQTAFDKFWESITSTPVLMFADDSKPFRVEADSSDFATGAILFQQSDSNGKWHPIAFYSKSLNAVERNYEVHDKEMLAIIHALEEWRHFLEGARHEMENKRTWWPQQLRLSRRAAGTPSTVLNGKNQKASVRATTRSEP
jgi:hypothetical protein